MKPYSENKKLKVIEMVAGPGAGKSSTAHFLMGHMKARGYKVEFVPEIAKGYVWDGRNNGDHSIFTEQDLFLAQQNNLLRRMLAHDIDYVVTDTSIFLGLIYRPDWLPSAFDDLLLQVHKSYNNITFYVDRGDIPYVEDGRNQDYEQALQKDKETIDMLFQCSVPYTIVTQKNGIYDHAALQMLSHIQNLK